MWGDYGDALELAEVIYKLCHHIGGLGVLKLHVPRPLESLTWPPVIPLCPSAVLLRGRPHVARWGKLKRVHMYLNFLFADYWTREKHAYVVSKFSGLSLINCEQWIVTFPLFVLVCFMKIWAYKLILQWRRLPTDMCPHIRTCFFAGLLHMTSMCSTAEQTSLHFTALPPVYPRETTFKM